MRVKQIRLKHNLSQTRLAELTGIDRPRLSSFEAGKISLGEEEFLRLAMTVKKLTGKNITGVRRVERYVPVTLDEKRKEAKKMRTLRTGVPDMPKMKWNEDGTPDFSDLNKKEPKGQIRFAANTRQKDGTGVPDVPEMEWPKRRR